MTGALNAAPGLATGTPGPLVPVPVATARIGAPTTNQTPPSRATSPPAIAAGRVAASSTMMPPRNAAAPGRMDSQSRPVVYVQVVSGVYA